MSQEKIEEFLLAIFNEDFINNNKEYSYISQIIVITIKSLMPLEDTIGCAIDYERYEKELKLWYYYRNGGNKPLLNSISTLNESIYWEEFDDTVYERIAPIILVNSEWEIAKEEAIKNILYTTGKIPLLFEGLLLSKALFLLINNEDTDMLNTLKEEIINFSQIDFIKKYSKYYRIPTEEFPGNFTVEFEKCKIHVINTLNTLNKGDFPILEEVIFKKENGKSSYWKGIQSIVGREETKKYEDYFYESMCDYLYKLRKGYINPEALKIKKYYLPDIFSFNIGDEFFHTLLNKSKVIERKESKDYIEIYIQSKSGIYKFFKNKRPSK